MAREVYLFFHLIGFGLLFSVVTAGIILEIQYRRAKEPQVKAIILRVLSPIGLMSPLAILLMLITGIGNMSSRDVGIFTHGWLTAKIIFFAVLIISGIVSALQARRRRKLPLGGAATPPEESLKAANRQISLFYLVMLLLLMIILYLSVWKP